MHMHIFIYPQLLGSLGLEGPECIIHAEWNTTNIAPNALPGPAREHGWIFGMWRNVLASDAAVIHHLHDRCWPGSWMTRSSSQSVHGGCTILTKHVLSNIPHRPHLQYQLQIAVTHAVQSSAHHLWICTLHDICTICTSVHRWLCTDHTFTSSNAQIRY